MVVLKELLKEIALVEVIMHEDAKQTSDPRPTNSQFDVLYTHSITQSNFSESG
jgi:hypothetical protein